MSAEQTPVSFEEVRQAYSDYYTQQGVQPGQIQTTDAVLHLVSTAGELASYAQSGPMHSDFEKQEVHDVVGSLAISLAIIGEAFGVDPGDAALCRIQRLRRKSNKFQQEPPSTAAAHAPQQQAPVSQQPPRATNGAANGQHQSGGGRRGLHIDPTQEPMHPDEQMAPLSPNTQSNFFPMLDSINTMPPSEAEKLGITWCVPGPGGRLIDLIPDGRNHVVTAAHWQTFLDKIAPFRAQAGGNHPAVPPEVDVTVSQQTTPGITPLHQHGGATVSVVQPPNAARIVPPAMTGIPPLGAGNNDPQVAVRTLNVSHPNTYDPSHEAALFSPSHFSRDLFSPHNAATSFDVPYHVDDLSPASREEIYNSTTTPQHGSQAPAAEEPPMVQLPPTLQLRNHAQAPRAVQQAPPPTQQQVAGLPPALQQRLAQQQQEQQQQQQLPPLTQATTQAQQQQSPQQGRERQQVGANADEAEVMFWDRIADIEGGRVAGADIARLGLFFVMPGNNGDWVELMTNGGSTTVTATNATTFLHLLKETQKQLHGRLRRANSMKILAIKNISSYNPHEVESQFSPRHAEHGLFAPHTNETTFTVDQEQAAEMLPASMKVMTSGFSNPSQYVEHISGKQANFATILEEITQRPEAVRKFKVTYCLPSADGKVTDLIPDGRHKMVAASDVATFLAYVEKSLT